MNTNLYAYCHLQFLLHSAILVFTDLNIYFPTYGIRYIADDKESLLPLTVV